MRLPFGLRQFLLLLEGIFHPHHCVLDYLTCEFVSAVIGTDYAVIGTDYAIIGTDYTRPARCKFVCRTSLSGNRVSLKAIPATKYSIVTISHKINLWTTMNQK
jgi:hypothetical protein